MDDGRVVRVVWASQFAADVAPTEVPTSTRLPWDSSRSCSCATCEASRVTSTRAASVSAVLIDQIGVSTTDDSSARTESMAVATGCVGSNRSAVIGPLKH